MSVDMDESLVFGSLKVDAFVSLSKVFAIDFRICFACSGCSDCFGCARSIKSATDAASMRLRVDDIFASKYTGLMDVKPEHRIDSYDGIQAPDIGDDY